MLKSLFVPVRINLKIDLTVGVRAKNLIEVRIQNAHPGLAAYRASQHSEGQILIPARVHLKEDPFNPISREAAEGAGSQNHLVDLPGKNLKVVMKGHLRSDPFGQTILGLTRENLIIQMINGHLKNEEVLMLRKEMRKRHSKRETVAGLIREVVARPGLPGNLTGENRITKEIKTVAQTMAFHTNVNRTINYAM